MRMTGSVDLGPTVPRKRTARRRLSPLAGCWSFAGSAEGASGPVRAKVRVCGLACRERQEQCKPRGRKQAPKRYARRGTRTPPSGRSRNAVNRYDTLPTKWLSRLTARNCAGRASGATRERHGRYRVAENPPDTLGVCGIDRGVFCQIVATLDRDEPWPSRPDLSADDQLRDELAAFERFGTATQVVALVPEYPRCVHRSCGPETASMRSSSAGPGWRWERESLGHSIDGNMSNREAVSASFDVRFSAFERLSPPLWCAGPATCSIHESRGVIHEDRCPDPQVQSPPRPSTPWSRRPRCTTRSS